MPKILIIFGSQTDEKVYNEIAKLSPRLIVIWGGMIVDERILSENAASNAPWVILLSVARAPAPKEKV